MRAMLQRLTDTASGLILRFPLAGWAGWIAFCVIALARVTPQRFDSTFTVYIDAAKHLLAHRQVYELDSLGGYFYLPAGLLPYIPFTSIAPSMAAGFWLAVFAAMFTLGLLLADGSPAGAGRRRAHSLVACWHGAADQHSGGLVQLQRRAIADHHGRHDDACGRCDHAAISSSSTATSSSSYG